MKYTKIATTACFLLINFSANAATISSTDSVIFETYNQSMWEPGAGQINNASVYSASWNESVTAGTIVGAKNEWIPKITDSVFSHTANVTKIVYETVKEKGACASWGPFEFLGDAVCSAWNYVEKQVAKTVTESVDVFKDVVRAGTNVFKDTRTGAEATVSTNGTIGVKNSLGLNGGTVDSTIGYSIATSAPDSVKLRENISIGLMASEAQMSLSTQFPKITGELSAFLDGSLDISGKACFIGIGCDDFDENVVNINSGDMSLVKLNTPDLVDQASLFGFDAAAFDITKKEIHVDAIFDGAKWSPSLNLPLLKKQGIGLNVGTLALDYPDFASHTTGTGTKLDVTETAKDVVKLTGDIDTLATVYGGASPMGVVINASPFSVRGDMLDVSIGPTMDISQSFSLTPSILVDLAFNKDVLIDGQYTNFWTGVFSDIPDFMARTSGELLVTPTYRVSALFSNKTDFDFDITAFLDIFKGSIKVKGVTVLGSSSPMFALDKSIDIAKKTVHSSMFELQGFAPMQGRTLSVNVVPEPNMLILLLSGVLLFTCRRIISRTKK